MRYYKIQIKRYRYLYLLLSPINLSIIKTEFKAKAEKLKHFLLIHL